MTCPAVHETALARLRRPLVAYCYQMLGSPFDAEDAVQDVLERAWRARDSFDASRASLSTWCYRIAHNVCVDRLRDAPRRPLPRDLTDPGIEVGAPLVPAHDVPWLMPAPSAWPTDPSADDALERAAQTRLAVTALLQRLPPRQRGVFVLRELVGCTAAETAAVLETSVAAVNSALQRARAALGDVGKRADRRLEAAVVERYAQALERADVRALTQLVSEEVLLEMPPVPAWSRGVAPYREFMSQLFAWRGTRWQARVLQGPDPALLLYLLTEEGPQAHTVQLFGAGADGAIDHVLVYHDPRLFALFETASADGDESGGARS